jgi:hypothetical protein
VSFILIVSHNLERVDVTFFAQASLNNIGIKKLMIKTQMIVAFKFA